MASLTVTTVTPAVGTPGGGTLVQIAGTGFDKLTQDMRVEFGGAKATRVRVRNGVADDDGTLMDCIVPITAILDVGDGTDVLVEVFNDAKSTSAQLADGYEYKRKDLAERSHLVLVVEALVKEFQRQVLKESSVLPGVDWARDGEAERAVAKVPGIVLEGPTLVDDDQQSFWERVTTENKVGFLFDEQRETERVDLEFDVSVVTRGADGGYEQGLALITEIQAMFKRNPNITAAEGDVGAEATNLITYETAILDRFKLAESPGPDLFRFVGVCVVEAVGIEVTGTIVEGKQFDAAAGTKPTITIKDTV